MRDPEEGVRPPSLEKLLSCEEGLALARQHGRLLLREALRLAADRVRRGELSGPEDVSARVLRDAARSLAARPPAGPRPVLNGTGVLLHTNLGRAPLAEAAREAVLRAAGACDLELDLGTGNRGQRDKGVRDLLTRVFVGDDPRFGALVANNTAAALLLALDTVANGRPVAVSRGELVAIGGDFRVPSILARSGASLLEVGTTNRTTLADYEEALAAKVGAPAAVPGVMTSAPAAALLKVHPSNFRIVGFTEEVDLATLGALAERAGVPLVYDAGAATPVPHPRLPGAPVPREALENGATVVTFSADKTLGGPQSGILIGRTTFIEAASRNPLARALRPDKLVLAALASTLELHVRGETSKIPFVGLLETPAARLEERARLLAAALGELGFRAEATPSTAVAGGGSGAETTFPSWAVAVTAGAHAGEDSGEQALARALRASRVPLVTRIVAGRVLVDLAALPSPDDSGVLEAFASIARDEGSKPISG
ncbi:MAG: L-seryl-tRNA(Sec) selenium transferase [Acidobacteria bacterium]|nr:L-seryl-tRNA(Sec) selenium transferase [Acidobacteriota bacterium]